MTINLTPARPAVTPTGEAGLATSAGVAAEFEALLLQSVFAPVSKAMGFYGDAVVGVATRAMARQTSGLGEAWQHAIDRDGGDR